MKSDTTKKNANRSLANKLAIAGLSASLLAVTACQPDSETADNEVDTTTTADTTTNNVESESPVSNQQPSINEDESVSQTATTEFGKEYMDSMDDMHEDMMEGIQANNADVAFAKGMLPHHEGAVDMAEIQLKFGKDETMRKLATDIIAAQEAEIEQMEDWLDANPDTEKQAYTQQMHQAYNDSMKSMQDDMMQGILSEDPDMAFAKGMLPHHQGAVTMAEVQLKYGKNDQMRQLAQDIIKAQKSEIDLMQDWIKQHS